MCAHSKNDGKHTKGLPEIHSKVIIDSIARTVALFSTAFAFSVSAAIPNDLSVCSSDLSVCSSSRVPVSIRLLLDKISMFFNPSGNITELRFPVTITEPASGKKVSKDLIPDALFGLEYHTPAGSRFRFFAVECDRATEPATTHNFNRKSWLRSVHQYREYVANGRYREHLKLTAPLLVLNVASDRQRQEKMLSVIEKEAGTAGNSYLLFQHWDDFGPVFRPPSPRDELLEERWQRAGRKDFLISEP